MSHVEAAAHPEQLSRVIEDSFANLDGLIPTFKRLQLAASRWHEKQREADAARFDFFQEVRAIADAAAESGPIASEFADVLDDCVALHSDTFTQHTEATAAIDREFVHTMRSWVPIYRNAVAEFQSNYNQRCRLLRAEIRKAQVAVEKQQKQNMRKKTTDNSELLRKRAQLQSREEDFTNYQMAVMVHGFGQEKRRYATIASSIKRLLQAHVADAAQTDRLYREIVASCSSLPEPEDITVDGPQPFSGLRVQDRPSRPQASAGQPSTPQAEGGGAGAGRRGSAITAGDTAEPAATDAASKRKRRSSISETATGLVVARYAFPADQPGMIALLPGDIVHVEEPPEDNWQFGENSRTHERGWFPATFVTNTKRV
eukprot:m.171656 g.171656  ORF g.171656 m.171656 type:complete len:372 (-) comp17845_c0_seq2:1582-2697(-)